MIKRIITVLIIFAMILSLCGCASILNGEYDSVTEHIEPADSVTDAENAVEIKSYNELVKEITDMVYRRQETGLLRLLDYNGDAESDVTKACLEVSYQTPIGAFAVYYMNSTINRIVSYYEAEISITYKRTKSQIDSIVTASTSSALQTKIYEILSESGNYGAFHTHTGDIDSDDIIKLIEQTYYSDPLNVVLLPNSAVRFCPEGSEYGIVELTLTYPYSTQTISTMKTDLYDAASELAGSLRGVGHGNILLDLCTIMCEKIEYDEASATPEEYDNRSRPATAYGALVDHKAISDGYATAFKAVCDLLNIECDVVMGRLDGQPYYWNIVELGGDYYHIDVLACDRNGMRSGFLLCDVDIWGTYWWELDNYETCDGSLSYSDFENAPTPPGPGAEAQGTEGEPTPSPEVSEEPSPEN